MLAGVAFLVQVVLVEVSRGGRSPARSSEDNVPDIPDGLVQLVHGVEESCLRGVMPISSSAAWRSWPALEQSADHDVVQARGHPFAIFRLRPEGFG